MKLYEILICAGSLVTAAVFAGKYFTCKRQLRSFTKAAARHKDSGYQQPVKVETFDKDIVALANELNGYIDVQQKRSELYVREKQELSHIISGISHDFRTPLTAALGYMQLMEKSGELSPKNREYLEIAYEKNRYLKQLSDDFFALSKLENSGEAPEKERLDFSKLLSEQLLEQYGWISGKRLKTDFRIAESIFLESDLHLLKRMLDNLFSNAEKYAEGYLSVLLENEGTAVVLRIRNGCSEGVPIEIDRIFEPFYRTPSRSRSGSGLGLYVVKCLSERLGGTVCADFNGTDFSVELRLPSDSK